MMEAAVSAFLARNGPRKSDSWRVTAWRVTLSYKVPRRNLPTERHGLGIVLARISFG
jgi:hypothetical protein